MNKSVNITITKTANANNFLFPFVLIWRQEEEEPQVVIDYEDIMGGFYLVDQHLSTYPGENKERSKHVDIFSSFRTSSLEFLRFLLHNKGYITHVRQSLWDTEDC
jgi:hypothetical protein